MDINTVYNMDCLIFLKQVPDNVFDLTITSPPYDNLRDYKGYSFDFENIAKELYRVTKEGGLVVWIINDSIIDGSESLTSFKQAIYFKEECGFKIHDTMIYGKNTIAFPDKIRYNACFEYMFILSKGKIKTFNPIMDKKNKCAGEGKRGINSFRKKDGKLDTFKKEVVVKDFGRRNNIWFYSTGMMNSTSDKIAFQHPATFPEKLVNDHIISWSNKGDLVFDPFMGSGTTLKMAIKNGRNYVGCEISEEYCNLMKKRFKDLVFTKQFKIKKDI